MKKQIFTTILLLMSGVTAFGQFILDGGAGNPIRLRTDGTTRMYIAPNSVTAPVLPGNIGIGTFTPPAKLTVVGDIALQKIQRETGSGGYNDYDRQEASIAIFENGGTIGGIQGGSRGQMLYVLCGYGNNQSALTIRHDSPLNPTATNRILTHTGADFVISSGAGGVLLIYDDSKARWRIVETPSGGWGLAGNAGTNPATQFIGTTDAQGFTVKTNNLERISVESDGDVGIGITTADSKLHVQKASAGAVVAVPNTIATFENSSYAYLSILTPSSFAGGIVFSSPTANSRGYFQYDHQNDKMSFGTSSTERMTIDGTGKIGIGTFTPDAKLDVLGDVRYAPTNFALTANTTFNPLDRNNMSYISINPTVGVNVIIFGISAPISPTTSYGTMLYISVGPNGGSVTLKNNASNLAADAVFTNTGADIVISGRGGATLIYDVDGWRVISSTL